MSENTIQAEPPQFSDLERWARAVETSLASIQRDIRSIKGDHNKQPTVQVWTTKSPLGPGINYINRLTTTSFDDYNVYPPAPAPAPEMRPKLAMATAVFGDLNQSKNQGPVPIRVDTNVWGKRQIILSWDGPSGLLAASEGTCTDTDTDERRQLVSSDSEGPAAEQKDGTISTSHTLPYNSFHVTIILVF